MSYFDPAYFDGAYFAVGAAGVAAPTGSVHPQFRAAQVALVRRRLADDEFLMALS